MRNHYPAETLFFFWSYIVIVMFILFNMVLAVIMSVYDEKVSAIREKRNTGGKKDM